MKKKLSTKKKYALGGITTDPPNKKVNNLSEEQSKVVISDNEWLTNWLTNRKINGQAIPVDYNKPNISQVYVDELGRNEYGNFDTVNKNVILDSVKFGKKKGIGTHELNHFTQDNNPYYDTMVRSIIGNTINNTSYTSNSDEIHSEMMRLRQQEGYQPDKDVTIEQIKNIKDREGYNLNDVNDEQLLNLLNSTVSNQVSDNKIYAKYGTGKNGIMKGKRKYANGTGVNGYIPNPGEVAADYNIMLAQAEQKANNNIGLKIVPIVSSLAQTALSVGAKASPTVAEGADTFTEGNAMSTFDQYNFMQKQTMAAFGMNDAKGGIEVEGKEVMESPNGEITKVQGPSHENGGVDVNVPDGTKIYSDRIKKFGESMAERKVARENKKTKLNKLLEKSGTDKAIRNTHQRTISVLEQEEASDLQTQEVFNNIMNMMQEFAYGTGKDGVQKYAYGTDGDGTDPYPGIKYSKGFGFQQFKPYLDTFTTVAGKTPVIDWEDPEAIKAFQKYVGTKPDGILGKDSLSKAQGLFANTTATTPNVNDTPNWDIDGNGISDIMDFQSPAENNIMGPENSPTIPSLATPSFNPSIAGTSNTGKATAPTTTTMPTEGGFIDKAGNWINNNLPNVGVGNMIGLYGDIYSTFQPMKNTLANRATDTPNINAFKDFGKDALKAIEETKGYVAGQRDNALQRNVVTGRAGKIAGRNASRSVNTMRAFDTASDLNVMKADTNVMDNFAQQMMGILGQQAGLENAQDSAVMQGEYTRDLADRQDKDNFSTQLAKDIATKGQGIQTIGKDVNAIKQNEMMTNIVNQLSKYGLGFDKNGNLIQIKK